MEGPKTRGGLPMPRLPLRASIYIDPDGTVHFGALFAELVPVAEALGQPASSEAGPSLPLPCSSASALPSTSAASPACTSASPSAPAAGPLRSPADPDRTA